MEQEKKYSYWLSSGIYSGLQKLAVLFFGFGSMLILVRHLTKDEMGIWSLFLVMTGLIEVIRTALIKNGLIKFLNSTQKEEHVFVNSAAMCLNIGITLAFGLAIATLSVPLNNLLKAPALTPVLYKFLPGLLCLIPFSHFEWIQNANADFKGVFFAYFMRQGTAFGLIVAHLFTQGSVTLDSLILYYNIGIVVGTAASYYFARKFLLRNFVVKKEWILKLWHFGKYVFGTNFSAMVFRNTDQFIVSSFFSPAAVALYSVCVRISNLVDVPSQVLGDILFPKSAKVMEEGNIGKVKYLYEKAVGALLAIGLPVSIFIFCLPKFVLWVIAGQEYMEAAYLLQITMVYGLFLPFVKQFGTIMDSTGHPQWNFTVLTVTAVINIGICYVFAKYFGLQGAALATLTTYILSFAVMQTILHRKFGVQVGNVFKYMFQFYPDMLQIVQQRLLWKWKTR
ncbi:O-antigen/teichoic acid export membrane protein [Chitinophaga skermanii]|uniref:O-antigen/teichoic acid export membrane protein n=1 Tax=Chitinophaga skermanii TaxID=331697 RepID=A0A327QRH8_9BACT|nr:flippase [Chitinophaga skermanii]RAJ06940.1 O-antigen/teichoic acid export membrane protein [Chitinophaga skermanii]